MEDHLIKPHPSKGYIVLFRVFGCVRRGGGRRGLCFKQDGWLGCS